MPVSRSLALAAVYVVLVLPPPPDRARAWDLQLAAVVLASFLYNGAMRPDLLPRKPLLTASGAAQSPY
jgi:hypothetical protein